jgi:hypothetical protein
MGGACSTYEERRGVYKVLVGGNLRERTQLGDPCADGTIILRWIFRKWDLGHGLDRAGSGLGQVAGTCECGNELSDFIKFGEFLEYLKMVNFSRRTLLHGVSK